MKKEEELQAGRIRSGHFHPGLRKELIREIESGVPRSVIVYQYGVSRAAISQWMRRYRSQFITCIVLSGLTGHCIDITGFNHKSV